MCDSVTPKCVTKLFLCLGMSEHQYLNMSQNLLFLHLNHTSFSAHSPLLVDAQPPLINSKLNLVGFLPFLTPSQMLFMRTNLASSTIPGIIHISILGFITFDLISDSYVCICISHYTVSSYYRIMELIHSFILLLIITKPVQMLIDVCLIESKCLLFGENQNHKH